MRWLTLLAPDIVGAILDGRQTALQLENLLTPFPVEWERQREILRLGLFGQQETA
jgi:hypothetical protein